MESDENLMQASHHLELAYQTFKQRFNRRVCIDVPNGRIARVLEEAGRLHDLRRITKEVHQLSGAQQLGIAADSTRSLPKGLAPEWAGLDRAHISGNAVA